MHHPPRSGGFFLGKKSRGDRPKGGKRVRVCDPAQSRRAAWPVQVELGRHPQMAESLLIFPISREGKSTKIYKKENRSKWNGFHERA